MGKEGLPHGGHRDRVRELVERGGIRLMPEYQVLEYILFSGIPYKDTKPIAKNLLQKYGSIREVFDADVTELSKLAGMTRNAALVLRSYGDVFRRFYDYGKIILDKNNILTHVRDMFTNDSTERFVVVALLNSGEVASTDIISYGDADSVSLKTGDIISKFLRNGVSKLFIAHNHPSGVALPSRTDLENTRFLISYLSPLGITLIDHFIVGRDCIYSMDLKIRFSLDGNAVYTKSF